VVKGKSSQGGVLISSVATSCAAIVVAFAAGFSSVAHLCGGVLAPGSMRAKLCSAAHVAPARSVASTPAAAAAKAPVPAATIAEQPLEAKEEAIDKTWMHTTNPGMGVKGFNWTQLSMSRVSNFPKGDVKHYTAEMIKEKGAFWLYHTTFARTIPAVVYGLGKQYSDRVSKMRFADIRREWGHQKVVVAFSDHPNFNRGVADPVYGRTVQHPDRVSMTFNEYLDMVENPHPDEHIAVQQSPSQDFSEWGLPSLPPQLEELVKYTLNARNFWAATPPKVSVLHYDWQDSVLLQLSGSKRFTIIDPARLNTAYPCVAYLQQLKRVAPGKFERVLTPRELDNFPLLNVTHPDLERHPLSKDAHVFQVTINEGDALLLPAYWYHQVESFAEPDHLNVAINYWFQGHSLATRLYRTMRENVFTNCTEKMPAGVPHPCRD